LDIYNTSSRKQQSTGRHIAPLGHVIPIPSQLVFALIPSCQEAEIANFTTAVDRGFETGSDQPKYSKISNLCFLT
jgi:hypothetical protein